MSRFRLRGCHPLRRAFPGPSATVPSRRCRRSYNPARCVATPAVWALPLSLATTRGIIVIFSSCGYLDVSVPRVRSALCAVTGSLPPGSPIRTSAVVRGFAPRRRFSQLVTSFFASESHRHPPCALLCFPFSFRLFNRSSSSRSVSAILLAATLSILDSISKLSRILSVSHRSILAEAADLLVHHVNDLSVGGGYRIRTDDPLRARQVL